MPELNDKTRVFLKPIELIQQQIPIQPKQYQIQNTDQIEKYKNLQNFYNTNFWGYGVGGQQTNYNPSIPEGRTAIQANFNYAKDNAKNFAETLLTAGATEGIGQAVKWATTPVEIGQGAEAIVSSAPLSTKVTKVTTIPRTEMHVRNTVPGALKSNYIGTSSGLNTYTQSKVKILSKEQLAKASKTLEKIMTSRGWKKITHPNLQGVGYTNGNWVVSDLGLGNIGRDMLGRVRLTDFSIETMPAFRMAMQKRGGKLINNN